MFYKKIFILLFSLMTVSGVVFSQEVISKDSLENRIFRMSITELLSVNVSIATLNAQKLEEAPSIVTVLSNKEIMNYGYLDLSDILRTIPGFDFGFDVTANIGLSFRGIWAHEGKCLITINGIMVNDQAYGNFNYFQSIPADMIEKIEIIRGPGSALYGGFAEVAVINVITKQGSNKNVFAKGTLAAGLLGSEGFNNRMNANFAMKDDSSNSYISGSVGQNVGYVTTKDYVDNYGNVMEFNSKTSQRKWNHFVIDSKFKNLFLNFNYNQFDFYAQDGFTSILPAVNGQNLDKTRSNSWAFRTKYLARLGQRLKLYPIFEYNKTSPVAFGIIPNQPLFNNMNPSVETSRLLGEVVCDHQKNNTRILLGVGYVYNMATGYDQYGKGIFYSRSKNDTVSDQSTSHKYVFVQGEQKIGNYTFTVGGRIEGTTFGNAFAPRVGVTYVRNKFNAKLLYGNSYRIPTVINAYYRTFVSRTVDLKPENVQTFELELGYKLLKGLVVKGNAFYISISDPIVYLSNSNTYHNYGKQNSVGFEFELKYNSNMISSYVTTSYFKPVNTSVEFLSLDEKRFLGLSPFKGTAGVSKELGKFQVSPSLVFYSQKTGQGTALTENNNMVFDPIFLCNINIGYSITSDFKIYFGVNNILNSKYYLAQPYYGYHAAMPAFDRNIFSKITYEF